MKFGNMLPAVPASQAMGAKRRRVRQPMDSLMAWHSDTVFREDIQAVCHGLVDADNPMPVIQNRDQVRNRVESPFPFFLGPQNRIFGSFVLGDIAEISDNPIDLTCRTELRNVSSVKILRLTVHIQNG